MPRIELTRLREKGVRELSVLHSLLDDVLIGHIGLVDDGHPVVIPTAVVRDENTLLVHGSTGSRWMRALADGVPACVTVTALDGLVVARSTFESSMHYRSAVVFGTFEPVPATDVDRSLDVVSEHLLPGRSAEVRRPTPREVAATLLLRMPIETWSLKVSHGWPEDEPTDVAGDSWAGVVPLVTSHGEPLPAPDLRPDIPVPPSVAALR